MISSCQSLFRCPSSCSALNGSSARLCSAASVRVVAMAAVPTLPTTLSRPYLNRSLHKRPTWFHRVLSSPTHAPFQIESRSCSGPMYWSRVSSSQALVFVLTAASAAGASLTATDVPSENVLASILVEVSTSAVGPAGRLAHCRVCRHSIVAAVVSCSNRTTNSGPVHSPRCP